MQEVQISRHYAVCCRSKQLQLKRSKPFTPTVQSRKRFRFGVSFVETEDTEEGNEDNIKSFDCFKIDNTEVIGNQSPPDDLIDCLVDGVHNKNAVVWDIENSPRDILKSCATGKPLTANHHISLLGKDVAKQLGALKLGINAATLEGVKGFPKIKDIRAKLSVDPYVKPAQQPVRKIPISVEQVENKIKEALQKDIIERDVEPSAWISPVVIILNFFKENSKKKLSTAYL
nr:unnamed protein product [Callosobruchus analis]